MSDIDVQLWRTTLETSSSKNNILQRGRKLHFALHCIDRDCALCYKISNIDAQHYLTIQWFSCCKYSHIYGLIQSCAVGWKGEYWNMLSRVIQVFPKWTVIVPDDGSAFGRKVTHKWQKYSTKQASKSDAVLPRTTLPEVGNGRMWDSKMGFSAWELLIWDPGSDSICAYVRCDSILPFHCPSFSNSFMALWLDNIRLTWKCFEEKTRLVHIKYTSDVKVMQSLTQRSHFRTCFKSINTTPFHHGTKLVGVTLALQSLFFILATVWTSRVFSLLSD